MDELACVRALSCIIITKLCIKAELIDSIQRLFDIHLISSFLLQFPIYMAYYRLKLYFHPTFYFRMNVVIFRSPEALANKNKCESILIRFSVPFGFKYTASFCSSFQCIIFYLYNILNKLNLMVAEHITGFYQNHNKKWVFSNFIFVSFMIQQK